MLSLILLTLLSGGSTAGCEKTSEGPITLIVEAIDELRLPLPGAAIVVRGPGKSSDCVSATTNAEGIARFSLSKAGHYDVEASLVGFKASRKRRIGVDADRAKSIPHVQIKLNVAVATDVM